MDFPEEIKQLFEPALLQEFAGTVQLVSLDAGALFFDAGQTIRTVPIVLSGSLKISRIDETGKELLLYYVNPLESCAMTFTCCMEHFPSEVRASAEDQVELLTVPIKYMEEWMAKYYTWKAFVNRTIRHRFNELLRTIDQIAFQKLDSRLVHYLKAKSKATGSTLINMSHEQIAHDLASSREVISRLLKKLEHDGKVLLYRNQIKLLPGL